MIMKVETLKKAVNMVNPALGSSRNKRHIALTVLPDTKKLIVSASRGSFAIFHTIEDVQDAVPMNIEVDAELFRSTLMKFTADMMELKIENNRLNIIALDGIPFSIWNAYADLGLVNEVDDKSSSCYRKEIKVKALSAYINGTAHALAPEQDNLRNAFFIETDGTNIRVTATDTYRISTRAGAISKTKSSYILPGMETKTVISLLGDDATLRIPTKGEHVQIVGNNTVVVMPVISGNYFDAQGAISKAEVATRLTVTVDREDLINVCEMLSLYDPKVVFNIKDNKLSVSTVYAYGGSEGTELDIEKCPDDSTMSISFSSKFVIDALKSLRGNRVDMKFSKSVYPCLICSHVEEGQKVKPGKAIELVLPVNDKK